MQESLFAGGRAGFATATLFPSYEHWKKAAKLLLAARVEPHRVQWREDPDREGRDPSLEGASPGAPRPLAVPKAFDRAARAATCFRAFDRYALAYRLLWRIAAGERHVLDLIGDPDVAALTARAKDVRRDSHKMHAFVRFRAVADGGGAGSGGVAASGMDVDGDAPDGNGDSERFVAWFEPKHFIVRENAGFFERRFANMRWSILTPDVCLHYEGAGRAWWSPGVTRAAAGALTDACEDEWRTYYRSIFNPARLKTQAMAAEMPRRYWKNLPEAGLIPELVRSARERETVMIATVAERDVRRCGPAPATPADTLASARATAPSGSLEALAAEALGCRDCGLWERATQTVFGVGPASARLMLVGEQPGDREDLAGQPFVGPAGGVLDDALARAGIDRDQVYVTNAVKHFKFEPRGKRRIHKRPDLYEIDACRGWLEREIARIGPELIVCLGRTAGQAVLGRAPTIARERGRVFDHVGRAVLVTAHPASVLRGPRETVAAALEHLADDLAQARAWLDERAANRGG